MRSSSVLFLTVAVLVAGWLDTSSAAQSSTSSNAPATVGKQCADRAEREFTREGYQTTGSDMARFEDHYDSSTGRCLMTIEWTHISNNEVTLYMMLQDVDKRQVLATYLSTADKDGGGKRMAACWLMPPTTLKRRCSSEDEYRKFIAGYM